MRLLLLLVLVSSAAAQTPDTSAVPSRGGLPRVGRAVVGIVASVGAPVALYYLAGEEAAAAGVIALPLVGAITVHTAGPDEGADFGRTLGGALIGTLPAVAIFAATAISTAATCSDICIPVVGLAAGTVAYIVGPSIGAALWYRPGTSLQPIVLVGPAGERAAGVALRIGL